MPPFSEAQASGGAVKGGVTDPTRVWTADDLIEAALTLKAVEHGLTTAAGLMGGF